MAYRGVRMMTAAIFAAALLSANPASAQSAATVDQLSQRMQLLEAEIVDLRRRATQGGVGGALPSGDITGQVLNRLARVEDEFRALTGQIERIQFEQRRLAQEFEQLRQDTEYRLTVLEGGDPSTLAPATQTPGTPAPTDPAGSQTLGQLPGSAVAAAPSGLGEQELYDRALASLQGGAFTDAQAMFQQFLRDFADSPLYPDAQYWLGETYFVQEDYQTAARTFLDGFSRYPNGLKAPENMLKLGMALGRLGKVQEACLTLSEVGERYPDANPRVIRISQLEQGRLGCS